MTISLQLLAPSHVSKLEQIARHPKISQTSSVPPACERSHIEAWLTDSHSCPQEKITFVITVDQCVAGCCSLKKLDWNGQHAELSYWLGVDYWGKGIAARAAALLRDFAFSFCNFSHLHAHYLKSSNPASGKILAKLGFSPDTSKPDQPVSGRFESLFPDVWTFYILEKIRWRQNTFPPSWQLTSVTNRFPCKASEADAGDPRSTSA